MKTPFSLKEIQQLRGAVFFPPFFLILGALLLNFYNATAFLQGIQRTNDWMLTHFQGAFAWIGLLSIFVSFLVYFLPIGRTRVGGQRAKPLLSFWSWLLVSIFAHIGAGILFWSVAEPIFHVLHPPASLGFASGSLEAGQFALSSVFLHWTFTPIAILSLPGLVFALAFYNLKMPFSLSSCIFPFVGKRGVHWCRAPLDSIALYTLILGMSASLATGVLTIAGGLESVAGIKSTPKTWAFVTLILGVGFISAAVSGIKKGIKFFSHANGYFFFFFALYLIFFGFPKEALQLAGPALGQYMTHFFDNHLFTRFTTSDPWPRQWTVFYWAVWLAWTPITSGFLGRISVGYTVRQYLLVNLLVPSLFSLFWTAIVGGTALHLELSHLVPMTGLLKEKGPESLAYALFSFLPLAGPLIIAFVLLIFSAYVTSAASNITAMAGLSANGISVENPEPPPWIKILWGVIVLALSLIMLTHSGVEGIKALSYLGGVPALFFEFLALGSLLYLSIFSKSLDTKMQ